MLVDLQKPTNEFSEMEIEKIFEVSERMARYVIGRDKFAISKPKDAGFYLMKMMQRVEHEEFGVIFLDSQHRVIAIGELFRGTIDGAAVYPREVAKECLKQNAAACIFYHNHPSGLAEPSAADQAITRRLIEALRLLDIRVLDHLVVGSGEVVSLAERGWI